MLAATALCGALACGSPAPAPHAAGPSPTGGTVRVDTFWSQALGTRKALLVYLPPSYGRDPAARFPVAYYLHGLWGNERDWVERGRLDATADSLAAAGVPEIVIVMPDGDDGWYTTWNSLGNFARCREHRPADEPAVSYCVPWPHYDDYVARDVVAYVDSTYRTLAARAHRGIAGLSMGGYGAVTLALAYPDVYAAAASHSGVLAPMMLASTGPHGTVTAPRPAETRRLSTSMELAFGADTAGWWARDPGRRATRAARSGRPLPALYVDIGMTDPFLPQNRAFRAVLLELGIDHEYFERHGRHDWDYWRAHAAASLAWLARRIARDSRASGAVNLSTCGPPSYLGDPCPASSLARRSPGSSKSRLRFGS